ncbi:putative spermidine/putrescine transport system ATP-binding protein/spermidine/putrescine transport system ATP-binding protein [Tistlia consotensis]|uniref:Putative spermidine/putrescine transport system ATP-binding protein/spermidine/putrescine transport system ATP-binding protein n=1 Tax=Tistlia consotensis USBA 355 TaxID=560819 RepID=A0A1Y6BZE5_9PROT|nr:ABC transporter ATP-binding protein [Tistlia consotensis]SMF37329.1 putative spermidine/putrescine transport system ATP-binding protein/spermidine/putrescine transport system ATP-binding protein [Tistlia consotensis USBA 355]SNR72690.1 putative spermidine/putrescine transport system ATP-binding protein/spermidine/putrescine transport system ATP-binding protein [Tistlia consotensis]
MSAAERQETRSRAALPVRLQGVARSFGAVQALEETSLDVRPGEFLTLLGPSGCGKTTLLNIVAGFLEPDRGEVFLGEELVTYQPVHSRGIGMVFQSYALFPHMTVAGNVAFGLRMHGVPKAERAARVREALAAVALEGYGERHPAALSGGQQQRVALARAMALNPRVLLLDEPLSALDKSLRLQMQVELKAIQQRYGVTTIFVTHDQGEALALSDRIAVMRAGRIEQIAGPDACYRDPATAFVAGFVGDANRLAARVASVEGDAVGLLIGGRRLALPAARWRGEGAPAPGADAQLFVRPEAVALCEAGSADALPGRVAQVVFQGPSTHVLLEVPNLGSLTALVPAPAAAGLPAGAPLAARLDLAQASLFPADADDQA